ncbi:MAG: hypothetical protein KatS3mg077_2333 [Candidatus Binatia bacterium]|nr:MAG: hypothetical protein KatS3mg077_2333 [Candidatus Binatia bacterium]
MKRFAFALAFVCSLFAFPLHAEDAPTAGSPPAGNEGKAAAIEGCMPDGGCCGACAAARAQARSQGEHDQHPGAAATAPEQAGCPCKRAKQQAM